MKNKKQIKRLRKLFEKWITCLGLKWWHLDVRFRTNQKAIEANFVNHDDCTSLAVTYVKWEYGDAVIEVNVPEFKYLDDFDAERTVVHELTHILVSEMREEGIKHEERVVTGLTKAFMWTGDKAWTTKSN